MISVHHAYKFRPMEEMGDRLKHARKQAGFKSAMQAAEALGIPISTYRAHENGQNTFGPEFAKKYGARFKTEPAWLMIGDASGFNDTSAHGFKAPDEPAKFDIVNLDIFGGMGDGGEITVQGEDGIVYHQDTAGSWVLPDEVKAGQRSLNKVYSFRVKGESMEPEIPGGSWVMVDTRDTMPADDIYAVDYGEGLLVKRVSLIPQTDEVEIISANSAYKTRVLKRDDVRVHGRIIGHFKWRG